MIMMLIKRLNKTDKIKETFKVIIGKELTELFLKNDVLLLADILEKLFEVSADAFGINPLYCVNLPGYTWQWGLKKTVVK